MGVDMPHPVSALALLDQELASRSDLEARGRLSTGCSDLDEYVLVGGLRRGSVVGVSAEEDEMALLVRLRSVLTLFHLPRCCKSTVDALLHIFPSCWFCLIKLTAAVFACYKLGLQTITQLLVHDEPGSSTASTASTAAKPHPRAMIVTTLPGSVLLPKLRQAITNKLSSIHGRRGDAHVHAHAQAKRCLENISIARIFDLEGLWEVLGELDATAASAAEQSARGEPHAPAEEPRGAPALPDLVLITHASALLHALFTGRDRPAAHDVTARLAARLRAVSRSAAHGRPLIMLLNSVTVVAAAQVPAEDGGGGGGGGGAWNAAGEAPSPGRHHRPRHQLNPTVHSVFGFSAPPAEKRPAFGMVFSKLLDLHLLCTRVPRTRRDVAAMVGANGCIGFSWVVEVLLDEVGVFVADGGGEGDDDDDDDDDDVSVSGDGGGGGGDGGGGDTGGQEMRWRRVCREQRWSAVEVDGSGVRVVDAVGTLGGG